MSDDLIPVILPSGVYRNGTMYQAKNRYYDCNLVRWHDGCMRPIGGWEFRTLLAEDSAALLCAPSLSCDFLTDTYQSDDAPTGVSGGLQEGVASSITGGVGVIRDIFSWSDSEGATNTALGSNKQIYHMSYDDVITTITPTEHMDRAFDDPDAVEGFGYCPFGNFSFGNTCDVASVRIKRYNIWRWCFGAWGEDLIAGGWLNPSPLYAWSPASGDVAQIIPNAPTDTWGFVVTDERSIMTIGAENDPRLVQWCDREDRETWTPAIDNTAGFQRLEGNGRLSSIHKVLGQYLILSTTDAHVARFIGGPYYYGFTRVGDKCAPLHPSAVIGTNRFLMWPGDRNFWLYDGTLRPVDCEIIDFVQEIRRSKFDSRVAAFTNYRFNELWWIFVSNEEGADKNPYRYVVYDYGDNDWNTGILQRTAGCDKDPLDNLIMADAAGNIYNHELESAYATGQYAETGPLELGNGGRNIAVRRLIPDNEAGGGGTVSLITKQDPATDAGETTRGPYTYTAGTGKISTRAQGRQFRLRWEPDGTVVAWELGNWRFEIADPRSTPRR